MSKVYSFRLDENNPREAQAMRVIDAWVDEGYSLRHVIAEALITYRKETPNQNELVSAMEKLQDLITALDH